MRPQLEADIYGEESEPSDLDELRDLLKRCRPAVNGWPHLRKTLVKEIDKMLDKHKQV